MMDSRDLNACHECGHWDHPRGDENVDGWNGCDVRWMGERCGCGSDPAANGGLLEPIGGGAEIEAEMVRLGWISPRMT